MVRNPPKIHTEFDNCEFFIGGIESTYNIITSWSYAEVPSQCGRWLLSGCGSSKGVELFFNPRLFEHPIPEPYFNGKEIDTAVCAVLAHETGHILSKHHEQLQRTPQVQRALEMGEAHKLPTEDKEFVLNSECEAWKVGEALLLRACVYNQDFDNTYSWELHEMIKSTGLATYTKGLQI